MIDRFLKLSLIALLSFSQFSCVPFSFYQASDRVSWLEDLPYIPSSPNPQHRLDIYYPKQLKIYPVLIFVHGGYWVSQDKRYYQSITGLYGNLGVEMAKRGIGTVSLNYRLSPETDIKGQLEDLVQAIHWVKANIHRYGGNPEEMFLAGHSAGGHLITLMSTDQRYLSSIPIRGFIPMSAIFDIQHMEQSHDFKFNSEITYPVFGTDKAVWRSYSPSVYLAKQTKPCLFLYGSEDFPYIVAQTEFLLPLLNKTGSPVSVFKVPGYTHEDMVLNIGKKEDLLSEPMAHFIKEILKSSKPH